MSTKTIEIHRHFNLVEMSQEDPEVKAWLGQAYKPIGPYFKDKVTGTGLERYELKALMATSSGVGLEPTDRAFTLAVQNFYDNLITNVGEKGLRLEIGLDIDDAPISDVEIKDKERNVITRYNMPINIKDYIVYRHALQHPHVALSKAAAEKTYGKTHYILDPKLVLAESVRVNDLEDKAFALYMMYKDDVIKVDQILTLMGIDIEKMDKTGKILRLKGFATKDNKHSAPKQKEVFQNFIDICNDKDLEMKYLIEEAIGIQYLKRAGNAIYFRESGKEIGDDMAAAVLYFKNEKNSRQLNLLRAEYKEKSRKSKANIPGEDIKAAETV